MIAEEIFRDALRKSGIEYGGQIQIDGKLHRIKADDDHAKNSWYVLHSGTPVAGAYGCWKRDINQTWCERNESLTPEEEKSVRQRWRESSANLKAETEAQQKKARKVAEWILNRSRPVSGFEGGPDRLRTRHRYLKRKRVKGFGNLREYRRLLVVPLRDAGGELHSLQFINGDGTKKFLSGGRIAGCFFTLADKTDVPLVICESYGTGASIHEATGYAVISAMYCGNLLEVAKAARERWPQREIIIAADNDQWTAGNPGLTKATAAAKAIEAKLTVPQFDDLANKPTDFNDLAIAQGLDAVRQQVASAKVPGESDSENSPQTGDLPGDAAPVWTRPKDPSSAEVRGQIISIFTNEKFSLATKRIKIANAVVDALAGRGQFFFDIGARNFKSTMFFDSERKHLERISDDPFHAWLSDWLRINRADPIFTHVIREIETVALNEKYSKGIVPDKFWASRPGAIYLSNGDAQLVKITGQVIAIFDNGTDDVLFAAGNTLAPWKLSEPSDPFESCSAFKDANCAASHGPDLLRLWTISLPSNPAKKPPMCLVGEFGSGKTRLAEATAELYGIPFVANNVTKDFGDDDFWVSADAGGFFTLDNCDTHIKWLADAVAGAATGGHRDKRKLYTDSERYTLHARAWLCLTTANPTFASDVGLADRLLVVRMNRRNDETEDEKLSAEIKEHRDAGLSFIAQTLKKVLDDSGPVPPKLNLRHPDFAAFAAKIGRAIGRSDEVVSALQKAEKDKSLFCLENDFVASPLLDYLSQEKTFTGTASELRDALKNADPGFINKDGKPSVKTVGRRLNTLWPYLKNSLPVAEKEKDRTRVVTYTFSTTRSAEFAEFK